MGVFIVTCAADLTIEFHWFAVFVPIIHWLVSQTAALIGFVLCNV